MADNNKSTTPKKPKFNAWWIYGAVIIGIIALNLFSNNDVSEANKTSVSDFFEYLKNGDIKEVEIITNARKAKVYLTKEALAKDIHKKAKAKSFPFATSPTLTMPPFCDCLMMMLSKSSSLSAMFLARRRTSPVSVRIRPEERLTELLRIALATSSKVSE